MDGGAWYTCSVTTNNASLRNNGKKKKRAIDDPPNSRQSTIDNRQSTINTRLPDHASIFLTLYICLRPPSGRAALSYSWLPPLPCASLLALLAVPIHASSFHGPLRPSPLFLVPAFLSCPVPQYSRRHSRETPTPPSTPQLHPWLPHHSSYS